MHITGKLFECECFDVVNAILELQFTSHSWKSCLEFLQRNGTWPFAQLLNFPREIVDLHGVFGSKGNGLQMYNDGVKTSATTCVPHWLTLPNGL